MYTFLSNNRVYVSGFIELRINKTLPEVLYVNSDGYLPDINIFTDDNNTSVISFKTCQRLPNNENDDLSKEFQNFTFPFILLAPQEVYILIGDIGHIRLGFSCFTILCAKHFLYIKSASR